MPSIAEITSGHWSAKALLVSIIVALVGAAFSLYDHFTAPRITPGFITVACSECGYDAEWGQYEFEEVMNAHNDQWKAEHPDERPRPGLTPGDLPPAELPPPGVGHLAAPWGQPGFPLKCPECGEMALFVATRCKECQKTFFRRSDGMDEPVCPHCGTHQYVEKPKPRKKETD